MVNNIRQLDNSPLLGTEYIVEPGDNIYNIAQRFNTDVNTIKRLNNLDSDDLTLGQIIIVDDQYTPGKTELYSRYIVQPKDTLYKIAFLYNMTYQELKDLNDLVNDDIKPGQVLLVDHVEETKENIYIVEEGDTIYSIAKKFDTTADNIKKWNNLDDNKITIGDRLVIRQNSDHAVQTKVADRHRVLPNDNLFIIADKYRTTVKKIKIANNLSSNNIKNGQELVIP